MSALKGAHGEEILSTLVKNLDIADSDYEEAEERYLRLGAWLGGEKARSSQYSPRVFPQGSFALGTVTRQVGSGAEFDIDAGCCLTGLGPTSMTQRELKEVLGKDLDQFRTECRIEQALERKKRCWCLHYRGEPRFHLDAVPCVPASTHAYVFLAKSMTDYGFASTADAELVSSRAVYITDEDNRYFDGPTAEWPLSNPEGFVEWFKGRMLGQEVQFLKASSTIEIPAYKQKTPLQRTVQILKRHRDAMFGDSKAKPASVILATLAARAYKGERDLLSSLLEAVANFKGLVADSRPRIPNPMNPAEDFADRWYSEDGLRLHREENFFLWVTQAFDDFRSLVYQDTSIGVAEQFQKSFKIETDSDTLRAELGMGGPAVYSVPPTVKKISEPAEPWGCRTA